MSLDPAESQLLREVIESRLVDVHTSIPGRIKSYDAAKQTADVEIVIKRAEEGASGAAVHEDYPVIPNVIVGWTQGGGYSFQFPLSKGDHVWLIFSEAATGQWRETGEPSRPGDLDRFDLSYPIALPCARSSKSPLPTASDALVTVPPGGQLEVKQNGQVTNFVALANLVNQALQALKTAVDAAALSETGAGGLGGMNALKTALEGALWPSDVAASKLKTH